MAPGGPWTGSPVVKSCLCMMCLISNQSFSTESPSGQVALDLNRLPVSDDKALIPEWVAPPGLQNAPCLLKALLFLGSGL